VTIRISDKHDNQVQHQLCGLPSARVDAILVAAKAWLDNEFASGRIKKTENGEYSTPNVRSSVTAS